MRSLQWYKRGAAYAQLLRSIDSIKEEMAFQISWDESEATDVSLSQNPHLLYQLIRCRN